MRRQQIQPYLFLIGITLLVSACFTEPNYSNTPQIDFKGIFKYPKEAGTGVGKAKRDSVVITIGFTDGDGDLGSDSQNTSDVNSYTANGGWGNYEIKTFRYINKRYVEDSLTDIVLKTALFPDLAKGKPKGPIEGTLDFNQTFQYGTISYLYPTKFQIRIRDRALNVSNTVETDTITLPFLHR